MHKPLAQLAQVGKRERARLARREGGEAARPGAWDAFDVGNVHYARQEMSASGACVSWATLPEWGFAGDTRMEYLDRAVRTLTLKPVGWIRHSEGRWLLWASRD